MRFEGIAYDNLLKGKNPWISELLKLEENKKTIEMLLFSRFSRGVVREILTTEDGAFLKKEALSAESYTHRALVRCVERINRRLSIDVIARYGKDNALATKIHQAFEAFLKKHSKACFSEQDVQSFRIYDDQEKIDAYQVVLVKVCQGLSSQILSDIDLLNQFVQREHAWKLKQLRKLSDRPNVLSRLLSIHEKFEQSADGYGDDRLTDDEVMTFFSPFLIPEVLKELDVDNDVVYSEILSLKASVITRLMVLIHHLEKWSGYLGHSYPDYKLALEEHRPKEAMKGFFARWCDHYAELKEKRECLGEDAFLDKLLGMEVDAPFFDRAKKAEGHEFLLSWYNLFASEEEPHNWLNRDAQMIACMVDCLSEQGAKNKLRIG